MKIQEIKYRIACDIPNCKNEAMIKIEKSGFFKNSGLHVCKECMNDLYEELGKRLIPKSIDNMLNKKIVTKRTRVNEKQ